MAFKIESQPSSRRKMLIQFGYEDVDRGWSQLAEIAQFRATLLARHCGLSLRQLQRRFRSEFGLTPKQWLQLRRMEAAHKLVSKGLRAKDIAAALFFKDSSHFSKVYKGAFSNSSFRRLNSRTKERTPKTVKRSKSRARIPA